MRAPRIAPNLAEDLVPIAEFKTHASEMLRNMRDTRRPLVITQHGRAAAVVLTPEEYEAMGARLLVRRKVESGRTRASVEGTSPAESVRERAKARLRARPTAKPDAR